MNLYKVTVEYWETLEYEVEAESEDDAIKYARDQADDESSGPDITARFISKISADDDGEDTPLEIHFEGQTDMFTGVGHDR